MNCTVTYFSGMGQGDNPHNSRRKLRQGRGCIPEGPRAQHHQSECKPTGTQTYSSKPINMKLIYKLIHNICLLPPGRMVRRHVFMGRLRGPLVLPNQVSTYSRTSIYFLIWNFSLFILTQQVCHGEHRLGLQMGVQRRPRWGYTVR